MDKIYFKIIEYLISICISKRYTEKEIEIKIDQIILKKYSNIDFERENIDLFSLKIRLFNRLKELKYINDYQYAIDYINEKSRIRLKGKNIIRMELKRKGLDDEIIYKAVENSNYNENAVLKMSFEKNKGKWSKLSDVKAREKIYRYFIGRGFNAENIYKLMNSYYSK